MKPELTRKQKNLIRRTLNHIERDHKHFDMSFWTYQKFEWDGRKQTMKNCGTVCCFAGSLVAHAGATFTEYGVFAKARLNGIEQSVREMAGELIGVTDPGQRYKLFYHSRWPEEFRTAYENRRTTLGKARVLRRRVEHWMATGE